MYISYSVYASMHTRSGRVCWRKNHWHWQNEAIDYCLENRIFHVHLFDFGERWPLSTIKIDAFEIWGFCFMVASSLNSWRLKWYPIGCFNIVCHVICCLWCTECAQSMYKFLFHHLYWYKVSFSSTHHCQVYRHNNEERNTIEVA